MRASEGQYYLPQIHGAGFTDQQAAPHILIYETIGRKFDRHNN